jgi:hypothetical protein
MRTKKQEDDEEETKDCPEEHPTIIDRRER